MSDFKTLKAMTLGEVASVIHASIDAAYVEKSFGEISTNSRVVGGGSYFLALAGEKFDGHDFVAQAIEAGAAGVIVRADFDPQFDHQLPVLRVPDTLIAFGDLARHQRLTWGGKVLALSGSVGKTTTRRILAQALSARLKTLEPIKNYNNLIGVPQTLLRLDTDFEVAVLELGMNMPGEIERLTQISSPDVAGLTRLGQTHVGMFKSINELIEAKFDIFKHAPPEIPFVLNLMCEYSRRALDRFRSSHPLITFAAEGFDRNDPLNKRLDSATVSARNIQVIEGGLGYRFDLHTTDEVVSGLELRHFGRHIVEDVAAATAFLVAADYPIAWIRDAVENFRTEPLRGEIVSANDLTLILDCYNASPDSMQAALASLAEMRLNEPQPGRLVLVLADMLELGDHSTAAHTALKPFIEKLTPACFFGLGPESARIAGEMQDHGWPSTGFLKADDLGAGLKLALEPGDVVFFKGSHGFALETVAQKIAPDLQIVKS